jgi:hypothetical protein
MENQEEYQQYEQYPQIPSIGNTTSSNQNILETVQAPQQSNQYDRIIQEEKVSSFIGQTSPGKTLMKMDWMLKGFFYNEQTKEWAQITKGISDDIRMDFLQELSAHLTEDVRMTRLSAKQINNIMECLIEWGVDYMDIKGQEKDISEEQCSKILYMFWAAVFYTLCRSENGVERDRIYNSLKMGDDFGAYAKQEEKKSILSSFLPWR